MYPRKVGLAGSQVGIARPYKNRFTIVFLFNKEIESFSLSEYAIKN